MLELPAAARRAHVPCELAFIRYTLGQGHNYDMSSASPMLYKPKVCKSARSQLVHSKLL